MAYFFWWWLIQPLIKKVHLGYISSLQQVPQIGSIFRFCSKPNWLRKSIVQTTLKGKAFPIFIGTFVPETMVSPIIAPLGCKIYLFSPSTNRYNPAEQLLLKLEQLLENSPQIWKFLNKMFVERQNENSILWKFISIEQG